VIKRMPDGQPACRVSNGYVYIVGHVEPCSLPWAILDALRNHVWRRLIGLPPV
jgi:hypothetical protein